jgi:hypothetical protein
MATGGGSKADAQHGRFIDVAEEPHKIYARIGGYQKMPLVSLKEAVKVLESILPNIQNYAFSAILKCQDPADGLSPDESASIMLYTMTWEPLDECLYFVLNNTLRLPSAEREKKLKPWYLYLRLFLNALLRLPPTHQVVYRGVKSDISKKYISGQTIVWWGFSSCTDNIKVFQSNEFLSKTGARTLFSIQCETVRDIRNHSSVPTENELLLLAATPFNVIDCLDQGDLHIIHLKEICSPYLLLIPVPIIAQASKTKEFNFDIILILTD